MPLETLKNSPLSFRKDIKNCFITLILSFCILSGLSSKGQTPDSSAKNINNDTLTLDSTKLAKDSVRQDSLEAASPDTMISSDALTNQVDYKAKDSVQFNLQNQNARLFNKSQINYKKIELKSGKVILDWETNTVHARGLKDTAGKIQQKPEFKEKNKTFRTDSMDYNFQSKKGKLYGLKTEESQGYLHGEEVKKGKNNVSYVSKAKYTTCSRDEPHFHLEANKIKVIPNDKIISGPANLVVEGVDLPLYLPFGFFPNTKEQSSGLIIPNYGEDNQRGFFLKGLGYYWGISDQMNLLLQGNIYSQGSWRLRATSNYKKRYKFDGRLNLQYGIDKFGEPTDPGYRENRAFIIRWQHNQARDARPYSNFSANVKIATSEAFENQPSNLNRRKQNQLRSSIDYSTDFPGVPFRARISAGHNQNLSDHSFQLTLPSVNLNMTERLSPFQTTDIGFIKNLGLDYNTQFKNRLQTKDTVLFESSTWQQWQRGMTQNASVSTSAKVLKYFSLNPSFNYTENFFFKKDQKTYNEADSSVELIKRKDGFYNVRSYNFNASLSTNIYGTYNINKWGMVAARHVINPRFNLRYSPDFTSSRFNNFESYEKEDGERVSYFPYQGPFSSPPGKENGSLGISIDNNIEMKVRQDEDTASGTKKIRLLDNFTVSTNYNFLADSFELTDIRFNANTQLLNMINLRLGGSIDPYYLDPSDSVRKDEFSINKNGSIGRLTRLNVSLQTSLNPDVFKNGEQKRPRAGLYQPLSSIYYVDFDIPWNVSLNYNLNYSRRNNEFKGSITRHSLGINGNISLTDKWKIQGQTSYSMQQREFTPSQVSIHRDLHCWEMSFRWQPFSNNGFYMFRINAKSSLLSDLEYEKRRQNY